MSIQTVLLGGVIEAIGKVADDLFTSDKERLDAQIELGKLQIEEQKIEAGVMTAQIDVNKEEAKHSSVFVAGARPAVLWVGVLSMLYQFLVYPMLVWVWFIAQSRGWIATDLTPPPILDTEALWVLMTGILGIAGYRTIDKIKGVATKVTGPSIKSK